jgi:hypothetical protein
VAPVAQLLLSYSTCTDSSDVRMYTASQLVLTLRTDVTAMLLPRYATLQGVLWRREELLAAVKDAAAAAAEAAAAPAAATAAASTAPAADGVSLLALTSEEQLLTWHDATVRAVPLTYR